jgi:hypothetical protein
VFDARRCVVASGANRRMHETGGRSRSRLVLLAREHPLPPCSDAASASEVSRAREPDRNDSQAGRTTDAASELQMDYRQEAKRGADSTRTFVLPEGEPAAAKVPPRLRGGKAGGVASRESFSVAQGTR